MGLIAYINHPSAVSRRSWDEIYSGHKTKIINDILVSSYSKENLVLKIIGCLS